jgi:hypothetical protein
MMYLVNENGNIMKQKIYLPEFGISSIKKFKLKSHIRPLGGK